MSLFKVHEFWSLELDQLTSQAVGDSSVLQSQGVGAGCGLGNYVADWGQLDTGDGNQSVLVCGNLDGFICVVQVPLEKQLRCRTVDEDGSKNSTKYSPSTDARQILAAHQLELPIVDVRCGCFSSTIKQSIAALSFNQLIVFQLGPNRIDLITGAKLSPSSEEILLSNQLEELYRLDLCPGELAVSILPLRSSAAELGDSDQTMKRENANQKKGVKSNQLLQRISIAVRYTNQFVITLIEHKRVVAHFRLESFPKPEDTSSESHVHNLAESMGYQPAAYLNEPQTSGQLAVSLSDRVVRCIPVDSLIRKAKQSAVKKIAKSLLFDVHDTEQRATLVSESYDVVVGVDLESMSSWTREFLRAPLAMHSVQRNSSSSSASSNPSVSQLMVVSRYTLDLLTSSGQHVWAHRFEQPVISCYPYVLAPLASSGSAERQSRLMTLVCSDNLSATKSDLCIFEDDRLVWSALLDSRPVQIWRSGELTKSGNIIATLDVSAGRISGFYLGTNTNDLATELMDADKASLSQLEFLDAPLFEHDEQDAAQLSHELAKSCEERSTDLLNISAKLQASNQWPNVCVNCVVDFKIIDSDSIARVLHNVMVTLEFDDLFKYTSLSHDAIILSPGQVQVNLGTYWPDRGEPLALEGQFVLGHKRQFGVESMRQVDEQQVELTDDATSGSLPKDLKVKLYVRFRDMRVRGSALQTYEFLLPLNILGQLVHIDYSSGSSQNLEDVLCNLSPYRRNEFEQYSSTSPKNSPYYVSDTMVNYSGDLMNLVNGIIESDLVCRGLNIESRRSACKSEVRRTSVLENITLLAQSLDCRLRCKSQASKTKGSDPIETTNEIVDDQANPLVMISIAIQMANVQDPWKQSSIKQLGDSVVWLHMIDLTAHEISPIPEQFIRLHMGEWQTYESATVNTEDADSQLRGTSPILISIECDQPIPTLITRNHMIQRLKMDVGPRPAEGGWPVYKAFSKSLVNLIDADCNNVFKLKGNLTTISTNMHQFLREAADFWDAKLVRRHKELKEQLSDEYFKFHVTTMASLSLCKRAVDLNEFQRQQLDTLMGLNKQYQFDLANTLRELEQLKMIDYHYRKFPTLDYIYV